MSNVGTGRPFLSCNSVPAPQQNRLLAAVAASEFQPFSHRLRQVELEPQGVLCRHGDHVDRVHFPQSAVIAQQVVDQDGRPVAAATIGSEGLVGLGACLAGTPSIMRQVVLLPGLTLSLDRPALLELLHDSGSLREVIGRYGDAFTCQCLQMAACMAKHSIEERMASCLLNCLDGAQSATLRLTEDVLSTILGVRPSALLMAARKLQAFGMIEYNNSVFSIGDRGPLEEFACECYAIIKAKHQRFDPVADQHHRSTGP